MIFQYKNSAVSEIRSVFQHRLNTINLLFLWNTVLTVNPQERNTVLFLGFNFVKTLSSFLLKLSLNPINSLSLKNTLLTVFWNVEFLSRFSHCCQNSVLNTKYSANGQLSNTIFSSFYPNSVLTRFEIFPFADYLVFKIETRRFSCARGFESLTNHSF